MSLQDLTDTSLAFSTEQAAIASPTLTWVVEELTTFKHLETPENQQGYIDPKTGLGLFLSYLESTDILLCN